MQASCTAEMVSQGFQRDIQKYREEQGAGGGVERRCAQQPDNKEIQEWLNQDPEFYMDQGGGEVASGHSSRNRSGPVLRECARENFPICPQTSAPPSHFLSSFPSCLIFSP